MAKTQIPAGYIAANAITSTEIAANAINTATIAANAITAAHIAGNAVTASELHSAALSGQNFTGDVTFDTNVLFVDSSNDRVGIGTTGPLQKVVIDINSSNTTQLSLDGIVIGNSDTTANNGSAIVFSQSGTNGNSNSRIGVINTDRTASSEDQDMFFGTLGAGAYGERMRITSTGNVGIGITTPSSLLHIVKPSGSNTYLQIAQSGIESWQIGMASNSSSLGFLNSGSERMRIDSSGNVGIGTNNPQQLLNVTKANISQVHFGPADTSGGYLTSTSSNQSILSGGGYWNGTNWIATAGESSAVDLESGLIIFQTNTGLTSGSSFSPTERMRIDSSGNVGIGTDSPASKLTLLNNTADGTTDIRQYATFGPTASWLDSDTVGWAGAGLGELQIHNGTANRPPILSLGGSLAAGELLGAVNFFRSSNTDTYRQRAYIASGLSSSGTADQYGADLRFATAADGATSPSTRMTITSSGDITIGSEKTLWSGSYGGALEIKGDNSTSNRYIKLKTVDSTGADLSGAFLTLKYNKVGICQESPSSHLSVFGDGDSTTGHALNLGAGNSSTNFNAAQIIFSYDGGQHDNYGYAHSIRSRHHGGQYRNNALDFYLWRYGTDSDSTLGSLRVMELECTGSNGELKVGTQVLTETYNPLVGGVTSDALITGRHASQGSLGLWRTNTMEFKYYHNGMGYIMTFGSNGVISGDFNDTSDRNLKENIVDLEGGLSVITQLRPRNFDWKKEAKANGVAGFIAQEVEEILPNEVFGNDYVETESDLPEDIPADNGKHLNYNGILAHAVKAIQEQQVLIEQLQAEVALLKGE